MRRIEPLFQGSFLFIFTKEDNHMKRNFKKAIREYPNDKEELTKLMNEYLEAYGDVQLPINSEKEIK